MASRELTYTERRHPFADQELPAIIYALDKFRTYIFGYEFYLRTTNTALYLLRNAQLHLTASLDGLCRYRNIIFICNISGELIVSGRHKKWNSGGFV